MMILSDEILVTGWDLLKSFSLKECIYHLKSFSNLLRVVFDMINIKIKIQENIKTWFIPCVRFGPKCKSENDLFSVDSVTSTVLILLVSSRRWALEVIFSNYFQIFCSSQNSQAANFDDFQNFSTLRFHNFFWNRSDWVHVAVLSMFSRKKRPTFCFKKASKWICKNLWKTKNLSN